ncbi:5'/3'-nucleotidase SurE [Hydrogenophaga sp. BPS33]|uniref:5'/3'-nucleotidase SurE n=1 Tax=Hydrogenophaga sp. BPS33 TaxID=2651974 RepID=UPI00131F5A53|nr:5'/3'-nucleotidase SurE [Hydrogenophaga sp. BPS33]QHE84299.1 5'/3'-nucleotidase SurE [Hydrogenophaga sp. BPS33]
MKVLVTNDDGYTAVGLAIMAQRLAAAGHEVMVAAPQEQQSGGSASLGPVEHGAQVAWREVTREALPGMRVLVIDGPPAFSVKAVRSGVFDWEPEVVVSGINYGWNAGASILHSGTVGAALTACASGLNAVAISCAKDASQSNLQMAADVVVSAIELLQQADGPPLALNINMPNCSAGALKGVQHAEIAPEGLVDVGVEMVNGELRMKLERPVSGASAQHDSHAVMNGFVSITVHNGRFQEVAPGNSRLCADIGSRLRLTSTAHDGAPAAF